MTCTCAVGKLACRDRRVTRSLRSESVITPVVGVDGVVTGVSGVELLLARFGADFDGVLAAVAVVLLLVRPRACVAPMWRTWSCALMRPSRTPARRCFRSRRAFGAVICGQAIVRTIESTMYNKTLDLSVL